MTESDDLNLSRPEASFPLADLQASRVDEVLQEAHGKAPALLRHSGRPCPVCGAPAAELSWFWFESPACTWEMLCGRAGWVSFCDRDQRQVDFVLEMMN